MPPQEQVIPAAPTMQGVRQADAAAPSISDSYKSRLDAAILAYEQAKKEWEEATKIVKSGVKQDAALGRMTFAKNALDKAQADYDKNQPAPEVVATPGSPDNSFARHYQAMGDAYGKANPPPVAKPAATGTGTKAAAVVEKLKAEDKKGGANFWDVIEAASAGWGGRKSAYADARQREKEAKTEMDRLIKVTELQSAAQAAADARQYSSQLKLLEQADKLKKAGELGVSGIPGLSPTGQSLQTTLYGSK